MVDPRDIKVDTAKLLKAMKVEPMFVYSVIKTTKTKDDFSLECIGIHSDYMDARRHQFTAAENLAEEISVSTGKSCNIKKAPMIENSPFTAIVTVTAPKGKGKKKTTYTFQTLLSEVVN